MNKSEEKMIKMTIEQMREVQLAMLDYVNSFCKENGIKWWIEFGTLLGAVRHQGYIPWDDDIDIAMVREDYEKMKRIFNKKSRLTMDGRFILLDPETDKTYRYPFGKIVDTKTILYEGTNDCIKTGVYIDVFAYDHAPANYKDYRIMLRKRDKLGRIRKYKLFDIEKNKRTSHSYVLFALKWMLKPVSMRLVNKLMLKNARKYMGTKTGRLADFLWPYEDFSFYVPDDFFDKKTVLSFEGREYPAPANYDRWLRMTYGDYMILPPEEKRVRHNVRAYLLF